MNLNILKEKLNNVKPGTFVSIDYMREVSSAKAKKLGIKVYKRSKGLVRIGINYSHVAESNHVGSWFTHCGYGLVENKDNKYLQVFFLPNRKIKSTFTMDNKEYSSEELYEMGYITKVAFDTEAITKVINIENIIKVGK